MSPVDVSKEVLTATSHTYALASYATPELKTLFNDWLLEIELLVTAFVRERRRVDPEEVARHFKLQHDSVIFILSKLTREGHISMQIRDDVPGKVRPIKE